MLTLDAHIQRKRNFFFNPGKSVTVEASLSIPAQDNETLLHIPLSDLLEHLFPLVQKVLRERSQEKKQTNFQGDVKDIRGRPEESFSQGALSLPRDLKRKKHSASEEEIFFVEGVLISHERKKSQDIDERNLGAQKKLPALKAKDVNNNGGESRVKTLSEEAQAQSSLQEEPFSYRITSCFDYFEGPHIVYRLAPHSRLAIIQQKPLADVIGLICRKTKEITVQLNEFRIGFEFFKPRFFGSSLGLAPVIQDRFYLEATSLKVRLYAYEESSKHVLPLEEYGLLAMLDTALEKSGLHVGFYRGLEQEAKK